MKTVGQLLLASLLLAACDTAVADSPRPGAAATPARQVTMLLDLSGSRSPAKRAEAQAALDSAIAELSYGDQLVLLQVHRGAAAEDDAVRWTATVPQPRGVQETSLDREERDKVKSAARSVAASLFAQETAGRIATTDLFATLHIASEYMRDARSRPRVLLILSDMRQSAHGIEMERSVPSEAWLRQQAQAGVLPRLERACVVVIGADATSPPGLRVREFWTRYFEAAGATLDPADYRLVPTASPLRSCGR